jgi:hypothetical protein
MTLGRRLRPDVLPVAVLAALAFPASALAATRYVDKGSLTPAPPYTSWDTAAASIQDAIDLSAPGDVIAVTNGNYDTGGRAVCGKLKNRVALTLPVTVRSVNGPQATIIRGYQVPHFIHSDRAVRCAYVTNGAVLSGFTLLGGATRAVGVSAVDQSGGGVWCESAGAIVSNCVVTGNRAHFSGGGVYQGTIFNCILSTNRAAEEGGGACGGTLVNCVLIGNEADKTGGGVSHSTLTNCTLVANEAKEYGGGCDSSKLANCIAYYNMAPGQANWATGFLSHSCTMPLPGAGIGNITGEPLFVSLAAGDLRLQSNSPCINSGYGGTRMGGFDLDGQPGVRGQTVDMGAYEFQKPASVISYAWMQEYGLKTDGSADYADPDGDGANNWQEWRGGANPTNSLSLPRR